MKKRKPRKQTEKGPAQKEKRHRRFEPAEDASPPVPDSFYTVEINKALGAFLGALGIEQGMYAHEHLNPFVPKVRVIFKDKALRDRTVKSLGGSNLRSLYTEYADLSDGISRKDTPFKHAFTMATAPAAPRRGNASETMIAALEEITAALRKSSPANEPAPVLVNA